MCKINILKIKMLENNMNQSQFADAIGVSRSTINRKLQNLEDFTVGEVKSIIAALNLSSSDVNEIFFDSKVA